MEIERGDDKGEEREAEGSPPGKVKASRAMEYISCNAVQFIGF